MENAKKYKTVPNAEESDHRRANLDVFYISSGPGSRLIEYYIVLHAAHKLVPMMLPKICTCGPPLAIFPEVLDLRCCSLQAGIRKAKAV